MRAGGQHILSRMKRSQRHISFCSGRSRPQTPRKPRFRKSYETVAAVLVCEAARSTKASQQIYKKRVLPDEPDVCFIETINGQIHDDIIVKLNMM